MCLLIFVLFASLIITQLTSEIERNINDKIAKNIIKDAKYLILLIMPISLVFKHNRYKHQIPIAVVVMRILIDRDR